MSTYRTELEKIIDEAVNKYSINEISRRYIENGELSYLRAKHGLDFDTHSSRWCFRSAKPQEISLTEESYENELFYAPRTSNIESFLIRMMADVRSAVNNSDYFLNECLSYSKSLAAPLFKYYGGNGPLIIDELEINSLDIAIDVHCFDWIGERSTSYNIFGEEQDRYHIEDFYLTIPFKELSSKKMLLDRIYDELSPVFESRNDMMDVDNITIGIPGMTLDISDINRNRYDDYYRKHDQEYFKRHASYKKDREVLTTKRPSSQAMIIKDPKVLQLIRLIYLFKISVWHTERMDAFVIQLLANKHSETMFLSEKEIEAVEWVLNYLDSPQVLDEERKLYRESFKNAPVAPPDVWPTDLNRFLLYVSQLRCFDKGFLYTLLSQIIPSN